MQVDGQFVGGNIIKIIIMYTEISIKRGCHGKGKDVWCGSETDTLGKNR